jgi:hypothetical protein
MNRLFPSFIALVCCSTAFAEPLDPLLTVENAWSQNQDQFMAAAKPLGFEWTAQARDSARAARPGMTAFGLPAVESIARFDANALKEMTVVFYARGDVGDWPEAKFDALVVGAAEKLNQATNTKFIVRGKDPTSAVKAEGLVWATDKARYLLEYSKTKEVKTRGIPFRAEFVRLSVTAPERNQGLLASASAGRPAKFSGVAHVKRDAASGDVWIGDVPMVDQGQKGYCVVASAERVMRYYGNSVDQQELAQVANTSSGGGTSSDAMLEALKKLSARLKVRVREVEKTELRDILKMMADYNRAAKKADAPPIPEQGNMIDLGAVYSAMDVKVLKELRTKNKADLGRFQRSVQAHINEGTPLLWTVMLGKVPEPGIPQNAGGHMRLIIGYNPKSEEILYSDSWGAGHELKRMAASDAWTITTGTMSIEPF